MSGLSAQDAAVLEHILNPNESESPAQLLAESAATSAPINNYSQFFDEAKLREIKSKEIVLFFHTLVCICSVVVTVAAELQLLKFFVLFLLVDDNDGFF